DLVLAAHRRFRTDVANLALDFRLDLAPTLVQHLLEFVITGLWFYLCPYLLIRFHVAAPLPVLSPDDPLVRIAVSYANDLPLLRYDMKPLLACRPVHKCRPKPWGLPEH